MNLSEFTNLISEKAHQNIQRSKYLKGLLWIISVQKRTVHGSNKTDHSWRCMMEFILFTSTHIYLMEVRGTAQLVCIWPGFDLCSPYGSHSHAQEWSLSTEPGRSPKNSPFHTKSEMVFPLTFFFLVIKDYVTVLFQFCNGHKEISRIN